MGFEGENFRKKNCPGDKAERRECWKVESRNARK